MNETLKHQELKARNPFARFQNMLAMQLEAGSFRLQAANRQPIEWGSREVRFDSEFEVLQERLDYLDSSQPTVDSLGSEEEEIRDIPEQIFSCRTKRVANAMKDPMSCSQPKPVLYSQLRQVDPDVELLYDVDEDIVFY